MRAAPDLARVRAEASRRRAEEWALALSASGIACRIVREPSGYALEVPRESLERAAAILEAYDEENRETAPGPPPGPMRHVKSAVAIAAVWITFFWITGPRRAGIPWFERGSADAAAIVAGELCRAVTALMLHADWGHVLANALVGGFFLAALFQPLGPGVGALLVLIAGAAGNTVNAYWHGSGHTSVGASTAVFAAVGLLATLGVARRRRGGARGRHAWTPLAAGLALLAMLGAGQHVDLGAHAFGFLAGVLLGIPVALRLSRPPPQPVQWVAGAAALGIVLACWQAVLS